MEYFKPAVFLDELYRNHYSINKSSDPGKSWYDPEHKETRDYIISNLHNIDTNDDIIRNEKKHYQLLRIIMFTICKYRSNKDYLNFIKELLMHLEELSISTEHEVKKGELYNLLILPIISKFFYNSTRESVTISNSIITRLINILIDDDVKGKEICNIIESYINSTSQHSKRYHPYSRTYYSYSKTKTNDKAGKKRRTKKSRIKKRRTKKSRTKKRRTKKRRRKKSKY
jgi:hypothetical protein